MYRKILLSCLLLVVLFTSCQKDTPSGIIVDIEDDFYINMFEDISTGTPNFQIELSTIKEQNCLNYEIDLNQYINVEERIIELTLNDLVEPDDCIEGLANTYSTISLPTLESNLYTFNISLKDAIINEGTLRVTDNKYELEMDTDDGIEVVNNVLFKIPENTLWGYVAYSNNSSNSANEFLTNLNDLTTVFTIEDNPDYNTGYYGYFKLDDNFNIELRDQESLDASNLIPFVFRHNSDDTLSDIIEQANLACSSNPNIEITLYAETGWSYSCN